MTNSKPVVFTALSVFLMALSGHSTLDTAQASSKRVIYLQVAQPTQSPTPQTVSSPAAQPINPPSTPYKQVIEWVKQHPLQASVTSTFFIYLSVVMGSWIFYPRLLLRLIPSTEIKIPKTEFKLPIGILLWLKYPPRTLDAWVNQQIAPAQEEFYQRRTVGERSIHIPIPVELNGSQPSIADFSANDLKTIFSKRNTRLLIVGEGGIGKTSLACQVAKWAMVENKAERLCKHRMLPVLIEEELEAGEGKSPLLEAIARQIKNLRDEEKPVSEELLKQLLEKRRILVIVDHLSEMSEVTQKAARLKDSSSPVNALVITSRTEDILGKEVTHTTLKPQRVSGKQLSIFMDAYLTQRGKRDLFDDSEYFDALRRLSQIVTDERDVTVLFAKLYADQMIAIAEGLVAEDLPDNVPDLMLSYVNEVNREKDGKLDDDIVQRDLKAIAWECLRHTFKPETAEQEQVINCLATLEGEGETAKESAKKRLKYLEERLALIHTVSPAKTKIRFALDPLAEYLAGLHLVELYGEDGQKWQAFLDEVRNKPGNLEEIRGFLLAVRDCCITKLREAKIPNFVIEELNELTGIDPEVLERERLRRKIKLLILDLDVIDDKERVLYAAQRLGIITEDIKANTPSLISLLKDVIPSLTKLIRVEDEQLRSSAQSTLTKIGSLAVPALIFLLKDKNVEVRQLSVGILRQIASEATAAVPALTTALKEDQDPTIRWNSVITLSKIIMTAKDAVIISPLVKALIQAFKKDSEVGVRSYSAFALGKLGLDAEEAIPVFLNELSKEKIEDFNLFLAIVEALDAIGFDLDSIKVEIILDGTKITPKKVVLDRREKLHKEAELKQQSSKGIHLEWLPLLASFTPPQKDFYGIGADTPKWL